MDRQEVVLDGTEYVVETTMSGAVVTYPKNSYGLFVSPHAGEDLEKQPTTTELEDKIVYLAGMINDLEAIIVDCFTDLDREMNGDEE